MNPPSPPPALPPLKPAKPPTTLKGSTKLLLVLLQLAIGWHFFYEGVWKLQNPSWSSKGYLKNSAGPASLPLRWSAGDPDVIWQDGKLTEVDPTPDLKARLTPTDPSGQPADLANVPESDWHKYLPPPVRDEWQAYFDAFAKNYKLEGPQLEIAQRDFEVLQFAFVEWLHKGTMKVKRPNIVGDVGVPVKERLREYLAKLDEARDLAHREDVTFHISNTPKSPKALQEAAGIRAELRAELDNRTELMKKALRDKLTYEQKRMADVPAAAPAKEWGMPTGVEAPPKWA